MKNILQSIRSIAPLSWRRKVGPWCAYFSYLYHLYLVGDKNVPQVMSLKETADLIANSDVSIVRFGDGEISLLNNNDLGFQSKNSDLVEKMKDVLQSNESKLLVCIPGIWGRLEGFSPTSFWFILHHLFRYRDTWISLLPKNKVFGDAYITRIYLGYKDKSHSREIFNTLLSAWRGKDVLLIEGEKSRLGVGNDMFSETRSLQRILCPAENAFLKYDEIKKEALKTDENKLILLSLGPAAKPLVYDLFKAGYRVIDVGHLDMEYEMFLRGSDKLIKVKYKYFNEINERNPEECLDDDYQKQIIARIL